MAKPIKPRPSVHGQGLWASLAAGPIPTRAHAETLALHAELVRRHSASPFTGPGLIERLSHHVLPEALSAGFVSPLRDAVERCARELVAGEARLFELPTLPSTQSLLQGVATRALLRQRLSFFEHEAELVAAWLNRLKAVLAAVVEAMPTIDPGPATLVIEIPLLSLVERPVQLINHLVTELIVLAPDDEEQASTRPGARLASLLVKKLLAASRLSMAEARRRPDRLRWPGTDKATPAELVQTYLADTPLQVLLESAVPLPVPVRLRMEHAHILAPFGHGKTQLMLLQILRLIDDPSRPAVIVIDSQGDAIRTLSRLARFDPAIDDRLLILDPADTEWPLRLNLFDINRDRIDRLSLGQREEVLAGVIETFDYMFGALLGAELSSKQSVVFRFLAQLMIVIPGANIRTLRDLLHEPTPYLPYIERLDPDARDFLLNHLFSGKDTQYRETRRQVLRRLFHVLSNPAFARMFGHERTGIDMKAAMDSGKIVLISTAKARLKSEWSAIFGRFMIGQIMQATFERAADPEPSRRPTYVYIDEAHEYFDDNIDSLLIAGRKYAVALTMAHQTLAQIKSPALKSSIMSTATRFVGAVTAADAAALAPDMRTTADFLMSMRKRPTEAEFAVYVRNLTPTAARHTVPFFAAENAPTMSDQAYARLLARIRAAVAAPLAEVRQETPSPPPSTDPDDFADHY